MVYIFSEKQTFLTNDFVDEIDEVDRIYFRNIEINLRDDISYSDLNDEDDED
jgi:hypothetical protein